MFNVVGQDHGEDLLAAPGPGHRPPPPGWRHVLNMCIPEEVERLFFLGKRAGTVREHEDARIRGREDTADDGATENGCERMLSCADQRGSSPRARCLFRLRYAHVHLITIKICVVWRADCRVQPECPAFHDL